MGSSILEGLKCKNLLIKLDILFLGKTPHQAVYHSVLNVHLQLKRWSHTKPHVMYKCVYSL